MGGDIIRITLLTSSHQKFFEAEAPVDKPNKVKELISLMKSKGVSLSGKEKDFDWWQ